MSDVAASSNNDLVYGPSRGKQVLSVMICFGFGTVTFYLASQSGAWPALETLLLWSPGIPLPSSLPLACIVTGLICCGIAVRICFAIGRGLPRLTVTSEGIVLETLSGFISGTRRSSAKWNSFEEFKLHVQRGKYGPEYSATTTVIGDSTSPNLSRGTRLKISDEFSVSVPELVRTVNARRARRLGLPNEPPAEDEAGDSSGLGAALVGGCVALGISGAVIIIALHR